MEIVFLGTSAAVPTKTRNLSAIILLYNNNGEQILFDAGEDIQRRFEDASVKFNQKLTIFISHMHGDHVIGLPGLLFHFTLIQRTSNVVIYGPKGIFAYLIAHKYLTGLRAPFLNDVFEYDFDEECLFKYDFQGLPEQKPIKTNIKNNIFYESEDYKILAYEMLHSVPTIGYRFEEKPRPGKFNPEIARKLNIPTKFWKRLQKGISIEYKGKIIDPFELEIVGDIREGLVISYSGDTKKCDNLFELASNTDVFICESTFSNELESLANEKNHMTAQWAAEVAKEANAKILILTHISSRYSGDNGDKVLLLESKKIFENTIIASDLQRFELKRKI